MSSVLYLSLSGQEISLTKNSVVNQTLMIPSMMAKGRKSDPSSVANSGSVLSVSMTVEINMAKEEVIATP